MRINRSRRLEIVPKWGWGNVEVYNAESIAINITRVCNGADSAMFRHTRADWDSFGDRYTRP
ncbi:MAG: hypothetical protein KKF24_16185 [Gammaproteobacteria bacterium]|nr:hypothetical protein [Gammaproteobacteria bacterium]MBU1834224.1 hypothetical protein [Gammaproteobacteria bacterium]